MKFVPNTHNVCPLTKRLSMQLKSGGLLVNFLGDKAIDSNFNRVFISNIVEILDFRYYSGDFL